MEETAQSTWSAPTPAPAVPPRAGCPELYTDASDHLPEGRTAQSFQATCASAVSPIQNCLLEFLENVLRFSLCLLPSCLGTSIHWKEPGSVIFAHYLQVFMYNRIVPSAFLEHLPHTVAGELYTCVQPVETASQQYAWHHPWLQTNEKSPVLQHDAALDMDLIKPYHCFYFLPIFHLLECLKKIIRQNYLFGAYLFQILSGECAVLLS